MARYAMVYIYVALRCVVEQWGVVGSGGAVAVSASVFAVVCAGAELGRFFMRGVLFFGDVFLRRWL